jgi:hypothetical protein
MMLIRLDEQLSAAREAVTRLIRDADRVCLGRSYTVPGSLDPHIADIEEGLHPSTREVTRLLWDAPLLDPSLRTLVLAALGLPDANVPGRPPVEEIVQFLQVHEGQRLIPMWM